MDKDKYKRVREGLSRSPISKLERLQQKLKVPREKISEAKNWWNRKVFNCDNPR